MSNVMFVIVSGTTKRHMPNNLVICAVRIFRMFVRHRSAYSPFILPATLNRLEYAGAKKKKNLQPHYM
jgi:hypothetical protein